MEGLGGERLEEKRRFVGGTSMVEGVTVHDMAKSIWTPARPTSHSKIMGINMELVPPLLLQQPPLFWEGFS